MTIGIQVGAAIAATRFVIGEAEPSSLALMRYAIAILFLAPLVVGARFSAIPLKDLIAISLLGIGQFGILIALLNYGMKTVPSAQAAMLFALFPLLSMLLAAMIGLERLTAPKAVGVILTLVGVAVSLGPDLFAGSDAAASWHGAAAIVLSALVGALCSVLYRPYLERYRAALVAFLAMLASIVFLAIPASLEGFFATLPPPLSVRGWMAVIFIGVASGGGYAVWLWVLARASPTRASIFLSLSPITAAILGVAVLGEPMTAALAVGVVLVAAGVVIAHLERKPAQTARAALFR